MNNCEIKFNDLVIPLILKNINKQYNTKIKELFHNEFTYSVLSQYIQRETLSDRQLQTLINIHKGIKKYRNNKRVYNTSYNNTSYCDDEGYWDDYGSMGYLN